MDAGLIIPFFSEIQHGFSTTFRPPVEAGTPMINEGMKCLHDGPGIISISDDFTWQVMLSMAAGEMINRECLNAKSASQRNNISIYFPSVLMGKNHRFNSSSDTPGALIPCKSHCGEVMLARAIRPLNVGAKAA